MRAGREVESTHYRSWNIMMGTRRLATLATAAMCERKAAGRRARFVEQGRQHRSIILSAKAGAETAMMVGG